MIVTRSLRTNIAQGTQSHLPNYMTVLCNWMCVIIVFVPSRKRGQIHIYMHDTSPHRTLPHARTTPMFVRSKPSNPLKPENPKQDLPNSHTETFNRSTDLEKLPFLVVPTIRGKRPDLLAEPRELRCILDFSFVMRNDMVSAVCRACRLCVL